MTVMQQLSQPPAVFVDRGPLLDWMSERVEAARLAGRCAYLVLHGPAGVGARSAVQEWFARQSEWFPDGSLRVQLGDAVSGEEALPAEALADLLVELQVRREDLPPSVTSRANMLRSRTHALRVLLVIEEVSNAAQVDHFLLNSPGSAVVVIARSRIRKLELMGFEAMRVEPLAEKFGIELFDRMLGTEWFREARVAPQSVARVCGGYPLAIRATAAQIAGTPEWEVADLIRDLASRGLGALDPESQEYVRDSFDRAYQRLTPDQARAYRLIVGLYPGAKVFVDAAAVMLDLPPDQVRKMFAELVAAQLLSRVSADGFEYHDVAHWHARDRAETDESFAQQLAAVERVVRWYLAETVRRDRVLSDRPRIGPGYLTPDPAAPSRKPALAWLEERRRTLFAVVTLAERFQLPDVVWQLCEALWGVYHLHGHYEEWISTHRVGTEAAAQLGDPSVVAKMNSQLASALLGVGDLDEADKAFAEVARSGDAVTVQSALEWRGKIARAKREFAAALDYFARSWAVAASGVPEHLRPRMFALLWLQRARTLVLAGEHENARQAAEHAVAYFTGTAESDNLAKSLLVLAQSQVPADASVARQAARLFRDDGSTQGEREALETIADPRPDELERLAELRSRSADRDGDDVSHA